jgi:hypothetical protein
MGDTDTTLSCSRHQYTSSAPPQDGELSEPEVDCTENIDAQEAGAEAEQRLEVEESCCTSGASRVRVSQRGRIQLGT